jgi:GDPmannose 4,6-dehydratase
MWRLLQYDEARGFVLATEVSHTVRDFAQYAFGHLDLDWEKYVKYDESYERPSEVDALIGDPSRA